MPASRNQMLGDFLKAAREAARLTLREVEEKTGGHIKNGYLSQIENRLISRPSPNILWELAELYGLGYAELLKRAGHRVPEQSVAAWDQTIAGLPLSAFRDLDEDDRRELLEYLAFLRQRKKRHGQDTPERSRRR